MKTKNSLLYSLITMSCLYGCGMGKVPVEIWEDFSHTPPTEYVPPNLAGVIFYRSPDILPGDAVNIYANNEYIASLLSGAYQQVALCPENQLINAEYAKQDPAYVRKHNQGHQATILRLIKSSFSKLCLMRIMALQYVRLTHKTGLQAVIGQKLLRQNHTLPRLDRQSTCGQKILKQYTLEASALFKFDKFDYANMLERGKAEIQAISQDMQQYMNQITNIAVIGHTDPDGSYAYNMKLSRDRADTVKQALQSNGINATSSARKDAAKTNRS
ncbi:Outer membrane protein P5 precursor [Brevundimonas vesicularis]|uniref:Outer membrane protein P5 n=1 Tax=Brevundimonas vesicularis TaxID=41276 RepID=A0A2X1DBM7_BREVE|nr:Outer membrane protein P5 precursor [Brevundimonas vesicularis]